MTDERLKEIEALYEAATPGRRKVINVNAGDPMEYGPFWVVTNDALDAEQDWDVEIRYGAKEDAVFDAEMYNVLPELLAEVRHLRAEQVFVRSMLAEVEEGALTPAQFHTRLAQATQEEIAALYAVVRRAEQKGVQETMTDHDTNRAIAEALTAHGFSEKLAPHDFADPSYLLPALEAWCAEYQMEFACAPSVGGAVWSVVIRYAIRTDPQFGGFGPTLAVALRNAFAAALGVTK